MTQRTLIIGNKNYSSWSLRPWILMKHANIAFDEKIIPLDQEDTKSQIAEFNPAGTVPVLIEDGNCIWESLAIIEHLSESAHQMWPEDSIARARCRSISMEMHAGFQTLRNLMPMNCRATGRSIPPTPELQRDIERIALIWDSARSDFGQEGPWLFGSFSVADAMFAPVASRFATYGVPLSGNASQYMSHWMQDRHLQAWYDAARKEPWSIDHEEVG